jgi:hypothetical protein
LAKKYGVKATKKVRGKRVYKKASKLKKEVLKKAMKLLRRMKKGKSLKKAKRSLVKRVRSSFGQCKDKQQVSFGKKRRGTKKVSRTAAMKAFRSFYAKHCKSRRARFGNGGNPPLNASMGYEFCPDGMGGVLGAYSTGLFPSPCMPSVDGSVTGNPSSVVGNVTGSRSSVVGKVTGSRSSFGSKMHARKNAQMHAKPKKMAKGHMGMSIGARRKKQEQDDDAYGYS